MGIDRLAGRAVTVAERLLHHGRDNIAVEIVRAGRERGDADKLGTGLQVSADPHTIVEALELLADKLDSDIVMRGAVDA